MKKIAICGKFLLLLLPLLLGPLPASAEENIFTVGCIIPLSGRSAEFGVAARNGIELARKNNPSLFMNLRFLFEDSLYDGKASITELQKFTTVDKVDLTLVWGHGPVQAAAPVAEGSHSPVVVISGQRDVANGKSYVVRFCSPHVVYADALLKEVRRIGFKKIAVVKTELGFINDTVDALKAGIKDPESLEIVDSFQPGETDFQPTVTKLKTIKFDLLGLFIGEDQSPLFISRLAGARLSPPLFGTHTLGGKDPIAAIQQQTNGAFFAANYVDETFHRQYLNEYGGDIQVTWAANAYDFAMLTAELFGKPGEKLSGEQIISEYKRVKDKTGVTGKFSYLDSESYGAGFVFPVVMKTITKSGVTAAQLN